MLQWTLLVTLLVTVSARPQSQPEKQRPADYPYNCPESRLSYFVTVRVEPLASAAHKAIDVDESECREWCTKNLNPARKPSNCSSYTYNDETRKCKLYTERSYPDGPIERQMTSKPKRLFEKYCMPEKLASKCAKLNFVRVDEMLLSGFAQATAMFKTPAECMNHCIMETEFKCKSAMYFYEEGECITNVDSINSNNSLIHVEDDDRVLFLQNDCAMQSAAVQAQQQREETDLPAEKMKTTKLFEKIEKPLLTTTPTTTTSEAPQTTESTTQPTTFTTPEPLSSPATETTPLIEKVENDESSEIQGGPLESTSKLQNPSQADQTEKPIMEEKPAPVEEPKMTEAVVAKQPLKEENFDDNLKIAKNVDISFMNSAEQHEELKHEKTEDRQPQYGVKILTPTSEGILQVETDATIKQTKYGFSKSLKHEVSDLSKQTKVRNVLKEFEVVPPPSDPPSVLSEENRYFSTWSGWTPCTNVGERRIRRRKCLNFQKCRGSLMQIDYCPPESIIQEEVPEEQLNSEALVQRPLEPVRRPLPVARNEADEVAGSPPAILPEQLPRKQAELLPEGAPGGPDDIWSPWSGACEQFVSTQPCKNNQIIGFESRECISKNPQNCKGPFFRYCTLPC